MASLFQIHEPGETPDPHAGDVAVGIDLGTTHSVIALADGGRATVLADAEGRRLVPSVVHYGTDGGVTVGSHAAEKQKRGDTNTVASIKRLMGRGAGDEAARTFSHSSVPGDGPLRLKIAGKIRTPIEISADILRHLKAQAEVALAKPVTRSVITVPAYFDDAARQATKDAARLAGLDVLRLINEPTAAALAYGLDSGAEGIYAVYDLGGGTFDISILKLTAGVFQVLATGGDRALGGDDIDAAILAHWQAQGKTPEGDGKRAARSVKEDLSEQDEAGEGDCRLTQAELNALAEPFIARTLRLSESALVDASVTNDDLQGFVLVGGSTRLASVRMATEAFFGRAAVTGIDPDEVVAVGAAIQAEGLTRGSDNLLLDVVPLSLGLETMGGLCEKIIHRNTPIPTAVAQEFTTYRDGQDGMLIHIVQGEREMADQNRSLARFELSGIPPMVAGIARIAVRFEVDADGLLQVSAREETTGTEQKIVVKPSYGLDDGAIERMLLESMQYAREDITERLLREARVDAERSLDEVRSAFARDATLIEPEEREKIEAQMAELERVMRLEKREIIDEEREQLHTLTRPFAERRMDKAIRGALAGLHVDDAAKA